MIFPLKVGLIGVGAIAKKHHQAIAHFPEKLSLTSVVDISKDRATEFATEYGIPNVYTDAKEMLTKEKPDLVIICTPPVPHKALCIQAMEHGAWVLCEKPFCASLSELDEIIEVETRTGKFTSVVSQRRFGSGAIHLKQLIESQILGKPLVGLCSTTWYRDAEYYKVTWRGQWNTETGGVTATLGIHMIDLLLHFLGDWREVRAMISNLDREVEIDTVSSASIQFENGAIVSLLSSVLSPHENTYLRLDFQHVTIELDHVYRYTNDSWKFSVAKNSPHEHLLDHLRAIPNEIPPDQRAQLADLLMAMETNQRPLMSGKEPRRTLEFLTCLYKSAITGHPIIRGSITPDYPFYFALNGGN
jgi:predicted dehydrogenase